MLIYYLLVVSFWLMGLAVLSLVLFVIRGWFGRWPVLVIGSLALAYLGHSWWNLHVACVNGCGGKDDLIMSGSSLGGIYVFACIAVATSIMGRPQKHEAEALRLLRKIKWVGR